MLSLRRLAPIAVVGLAAAASCDDPTSLPPHSDQSPEAWAPSLSVVSGVPAVCSDRTEVGLMLGSRIRSGSVEVANDESNLYVTFRSDDGRPILARVATAPRIEVKKNPTRMSLLPNGLVSIAAIVLGARPAINRVYRRAWCNCALYAAIRSSERHFRPPPPSMAFVADQACDHTRRH